MNGTEYSLDDYIEGKLENDTILKMVDIKVDASYIYEEEIMANGLKHVRKYKPSQPIEVFEGIFAVLEYKYYIDDHIRIRTSIREYNQSARKLHMDSIEFESYFNVFCDNKILAARILTADIMEILIEFYKKYYLDFEIILYKDKIYIRFFTCQMFEPTIFGDVLPKDDLAAYYIILKFVKDLSSKIDKLMRNFEF